jgi:hypothetical protein
MAKYVVEVVSRFEIETDNIDDVRENYEFADVETDSVTSSEFLDGTFTYEVIG